MKNIIYPVIVTLILAGSLGFFAGTKYQAGKQSSASINQLHQFRDASGQTPSSGFNGSRPTTDRFGGGIRGEIISIEGDTLTVSLPDGGSKLILVSDSTTITTASTGTIDDLKPNDTVMAFGQTNDDGSLSADSINAGGRFGPQPTPAL